MIGRILEIFSFLGLTLDTFFSIGLVMVNIGIYSFIIWQMEYYF